MSGFYNLTIETTRRLSRLETDLGEIVREVLLSQAHRICPFNTEDCIKVGQELKAAVDLLNEIKKWAVSDLSKKEAKDFNLRYIDDITKINRFIR